MTEEENKTFHSHHPSIKFVNIYRTGRSYGGPEEGGWWYDTGQLIECHAFFGLRAAQEYIADQIDQGVPDDMELSIDDEPGKSYPEHRPHYE